MGVYLLDSSEYSGLWWLPENAEKKIFGRLRSDSKGIILSLDGAFSEKPDEDVFFEIILGDSYGKKITLRNCLQSNLEITHYPDSKEYLRLEFFISTFFVGRHFAKKEDIKFTRLFVRYSQLEEWLGERLYHFEEGKSEEGLTEHTLKFTMPGVKEIILEKSKISIGYGISKRLRPWGKPEFETNAWVSIEVSDEMHIGEFLSQIFHVRNFLSLATGNRISILSVTGKNKNVDEFETIQISYREEISDETLFSPPFFPFNYGSISERLQYYLQNWFNIIENLKPTYDLFFGTTYNPHLYPNHEFLSFAQAIESYHSRIFDNNIMPVDLFKEPLSQMLKMISDLPQEYQQQLIPKAKFNMNRKTLRTKLKELFEEYDGLFAPFINNEDEFVGKVVDTRNYYTHYPPELETRAAKITDLPILSQKLRFILIAILLREIGFDNRFIAQALGRYLRFRIRRIIH